MVNGARGEQARNRDAIRSGLSVGEDQDIRAFPDRFGRAIPEQVEGSAQVGMGLALGVEDHGDGDGLEVGVIDLADPCEVRILEDRLL